MGKFNVAIFALKVTLFYIIVSFRAFFSLKYYVFQTIRPAVSQKSTVFRSLRAGRRCAAASRFSFSKSETL